MSLRRLYWHLRHPVFGVSMAFLFLIAGAFCLSGFHPAHTHDRGHVHQQADGADHHHTHQDERSEGCAICFFYSSAIAMGDLPAASPLPHLLSMGSIVPPSSFEAASVIVALWSGRAPPLSSLS